MHSAYLQTAVVYEYDPAFATETAQVSLNPYQAYPHQAFYT